LDRRALGRLALAVGVAGLGQSKGVDAGTPKLSIFPDDAGHEMPYLWRPASNPAQARTLVLLHGHGGNDKPSYSADQGWNVLVPLDRYGLGGDGSWWLGEGGDFFVMRMLHRLIERIRRRIGGDRGLYFSGSSMGGYGAILHGMLLGARAVYANAAQTRLNGTAFDAAIPAMGAVLGGTTPPYADLGSMVRASAPRSLPVMFLGFNRFDHEKQRYFEEHLVPFLAACASSGANVAPTVYPVPGHKTTRTFAEVLALFDTYRDQIEAW
jgi:hypothetical protein